MNIYNNIIANIKLNVSNLDNLKIEFLKNKSFFKSLYNIIDNDKIIELYDSIQKLFVFKNSIIKNIFNDFITNKLELSEYSLDNIKINNTNGIPFIEKESKNKNKQDKFLQMSIKPYNYIFIETAINSISLMLIDGIIKKIYLANIEKILNNMLMDQNHLSQTYLNFIDFILYMFPKLDEEKINILKNDCDKTNKMQVISYIITFINDTPEYKNKISKKVNDITDIIYPKNKFFINIFKPIDVKLFYFDNNIYEYTPLEHLYFKITSEYGKELNNYSSHVMEKNNYVMKNYKSLLNTFSNWLSQFNYLEYDNIFKNNVIYIYLYSIENIVDRLYFEYKKSIVNPTKYVVGFTDIYNILIDMKLYNKHDIDNIIWYYYFISIYYIKIYKDNINNSSSINNTNKNNNEDIEDIDNYDI